MIYLNHQRGACGCSASIKDIKITQRSNSLKVHWMGTNPEKTFKKSFKKHLTPKKKSGIIKISKGERKMQRTLYKKTKTTRGYWKDFLTSKQMKKFANREVRRKKV